MRVLITGRRLRRVLVKFKPDQPRAPAGRPDGRRWVGQGDRGGGGIGGGFPLPGLGLLQELFTDETGDAPWDFFLNTYTEEDDLAAQLVINDDETATTTEWDTGGVERWAVRQIATDSDRAVVTTTELARDGTGQITFGPGAEGKLVLAVADGELVLTPIDQAPDDTVAFAPIEGDVLKPLTDGAVRIIPGGAAGGAAAGAGALVAGMTSFSTPAGGEGFNQLSDDVRLSFRDDGQLPVVQERIVPSWTDRFTGGTWRTLPDVAVTAGPAGTVVIDGEQLQNAIGQERFDALGQLDGRGVSLSMQAAPVAPRDVPAGSIFEGGQSSGSLHSPQGNVVDWAAPYAAAGNGQATVLELHEPGITGLSWTSGDDKRGGLLDIEDVDRSCPHFSDVHQVAVEADMRVRAENPELSARELGTLIHREIAKEIGRWPELRIGIWSEQGILHGIGKDDAFLPPGAVRIDVLEDAGRGTVCVYDSKTGDSNLSRSQMLRYWQEALLFRPGTIRVYVIPLHTKR